MVCESRKSPQAAQGDISSTEALVRRAREGISDGFGDLYEKFAPAIYAWATLKIQPARRAQLDPEDVVQEVWWRALDSFQRFDSSRGPFRSWIFGIASHVLLDAFRRMKVRGVGEGGIPDAGGRPEEVPDQATQISRRVARDESLRALIEQISQLSEQEQEVFVHCGLEGLNSVHAAQVMRLSSDAVAKRWQRLRQRLRATVTDANLLAP